MAARFCSKCGHEIASTAQFCPSCGTPVGSGGGTATRVDAATNTTRRLLVPGMIAALIVLVITVAILAARPRQAVTASDSLSPTPAPSVLSAPAAPAPTAPAITNAPSQPAPSAPAITNAPSKPVPTLPPEDARYLAFLQQIEQRRVALNNDTSGATEMMQAAQGMQGGQGGQDDPDQHNTAVQGSVGKISQGYAGYVTKCNDLARDFRTINPPPDCSLIANNYLALLTDYAATISKLQVALVNGDIGAAMGAQGAQKQVNTDASHADQQLAALCTRFGVPKPFDIQVEGASSPLTGL